MVIVNPRGAEIDALFLFHVDRGADDARAACA
jgi:hypothetical protein